MKPIALNYRLFYQETQRKSMKKSKNQRVKRKLIDESQRAPRLVNREFGLKQEVKAAMFLSYQLIEMECTE